MTTPPRLIDTPIIWAAWGMSWLPDGGGVVLTGQTPPEGKFNVWRVAVHGDAPPLIVTASERDEVGHNIVSPDGRNVIYRAHVERGTSLWLADLSRELERVRRR